MRWTFHIARIAGIDVKLHATFLLLLAFYGFSFYGQGGMPAALHGVLFISLVFGCVLLHEFGHALAARRYGIKTADITMLPIGGLARLERMPDKPTEELVVAIAGPLVNVAIALLLSPFVSRQLLDNPNVLAHATTGLATKLFFANCVLFLFNLIPAFPMDGGRVLRALLAMRMEYSKATNVAATIGQLLAFAGGLAGLLTGAHLLILVAIFVYFGAQNEASHAQMHSATMGLRVRDAMVKRFEALPRHATLHQAVQAVIDTSQHDFPVIDSTGAICGVLLRDDLFVALKSTGLDTPVADVMRTNVPSVEEMMYFDRAYQMMQESDSAALPVVDKAGNLVGLFTPENVGEFLLIQAAVAAAPGQKAPLPPPIPSRA